jgi:Histidine kinase
MTSESRLRDLSRALAILASARNAMTLRRVFVVFLFCSAWTLIEIAAVTSNFARVPPLSPVLNSFLSMQLNGFAVAFAVLAVDASTASLDRRVLPYALAVIAAVAVATTVFWLVSQRIIGLHTAYAPPGLHEGLSTFGYRHFTSRLAILGLSAYAYVRWRFAARQSATLRTMQLERATMEAHLITTRYALTQEQVQPSFLIDTLSRIEDLYDIDLRRADHVLKELTIYLRAVIPLEVAQSSTIAKELRIANAYLNIVTLRSGTPIVVANGGEGFAATLPIPPMIILPLIKHALASNDTQPNDEARFGVDVAERDASLTITIRDARPGFVVAGAIDPAIATIRNRLAAFCGAAAALTFEEAASGTAAVIRIPRGTAATAPAA